MIRRYLREHLAAGGAAGAVRRHIRAGALAVSSADRTGRVRIGAVRGNGLMLLIWGFVRYRRAHQARAHVLNAPHLLLDELPSPRTLSAADDQAIMQRLLHDVRAAQSDLAAYRQDSTDYFTAWVHKSKRRCR